MEAELSLQLGLRHKKADFDEHRDGFDLPETLSLAGFDVHIPPQWTAPRGPNAIKLALGSLAEVVRTYLLPVLRRPADFLPQWQASRKSIHEEQRAADELSSARADAERAWRSGDYKSVVKICDSIVEHLTPAERKRLDISRRHVSGTT
jgi:hypothetical protein